MARTKGKEAIVEVDEEVQGRKRVSNEDARLAKRAKEEGSKAMKLPICFATGRQILPFKKEGAAAALCDGEKTEEEEAVSDKVNRLRGLLADGPKKLTGKNMYDVIRYLSVYEIVRRALKSGEGEYLNVVIAGNNPDEAEEECNPIIKKATKSCDICLGKGKHSELHGIYCSFKRCVPIGATVGPGYWVPCRRCHRELTNPVNTCFNCGSDAGGYACENIII